MSQEDGGAGFLSGFRMEKRGRLFKLANKFEI